MKKHRQFNFTFDDFNTIRKIILAYSGINLSDAKQNMVYSRLVRRLRALDIDTFSDYCKLLEDPEHKEFTHFINALTTNLTSFFRENHHFEILKNEILPELMEKNKASRQIRIWSAGCSTGMETYSIAMVVKEFFSDRAGWNVNILATDLDTNVLETARNGIYRADKVTGVSEQRLARWFRKGHAENSGFVKISKELKSLIHFKPLNLLNPFPMSKPIDIIFCRNVVIYFDKATQQILFEKFANIQVNHGYLFIGHSETLYNVSKCYKLIGNTLYQKNN